MSWQPTHKKELLPSCKCTACIFTTSYNPIQNIIAIQYGSLTVCFKKYISVFTVQCQCNTKVYISTGIVPYNVSWYYSYWEFEIKFNFFGFNKYNVAPNTKIVCNYMIFLYHFTAKNNIDLNIQMLGPVVRRKLEHSWKILIALLFFLGSMHIYLFPCTTVLTRSQQSFNIVSSLHSNFTCNIINIRLKAVGSISDCLRDGTVRTRQSILFLA